MESTWALVITVYTHIKLPYIHTYIYTYTYTCISIYMCIYMCVSKTILAVPQPEMLEAVPQPETLELVPQPDTAVKQDFRAFFVL